MTSWILPTDEEISRVIFLTARSEEQQHFFTNLDNPLWIDALRAAGHLTPIESECDQGAISYPPRAITQYIARVANSHPRPATLTAVLNGLIETDDPFMQSDLMKAIGSLDPQLIVDLLPKVAKWISNSAQPSFLVGRVGNLVVHALQNKKNAAAVRSILEALFELQWDRRQDPPHAWLRMHEWDVERFANESLPGVVSLDRVLLLSVLLRVLETLLSEVVVDPREVVGVKNDYSYVWASDLASGGQLHDAKDIVTYLLVRTLDEIVASGDSTDCGTVIELLESGPWLIQKRLALQFLANCASYEDIRPKIVSKLIDSTLASAHQIRHEYLKLLRAAFHDIKRENQCAILSALDLAAEEGGRADRWLYDCLGTIADHLDGEWAEYFAANAERFGKPREESPSVTATSREWNSDRSPLQLGEAEEMNPTQIAKYAREWSVPADVRSLDRPNWRGLAKVVEALAEQRPEEFSAASMSFAESNRTVVGGILQGMKSAVKKGAAIDWSAAIALISMVAVKDEKRVEGDLRDFDEALSWSEAKSASSDLLQAGFRAQAPPPLSLYSDLWEAIELLAANGTVPERVDLDGARDSVFYALNSSRSQAMYAAIEYLVWCRRLGHEGVRENVDTFFLRMLNPEIEGFIGVRAAVAQRLPALGYVDPDWAVQLLPAIFPERATYADHWDAAWDAYIRYSRPLSHEEVLRAMEGQYASAVYLVGADASGHRFNGDPRVHLGIHLVLMFLRGICELDHRNLVAFFQRASSPVRARVVGWVGRSASESGLDEGFLERACELFEWRQRCVEECESDPLELGEIGEFVAAGAFPAEWWAPRLVRCISESVNSDDYAYIPPQGMLDQVAFASSKHPKMALQVLEFVLNQDENLWYEPYLVDADTILTRTVSDEELKMQVAVVADLLARAGHEQFERFALPG